MYEYLPKEPSLNKDGVIDISCSNYFIPLGEDDIKEAEVNLGFAFPPELRQFYQEIGFGNLTTPINPPKEYDFCDTNMILHPIVVARFYHGQLLNDDFGSYMDQETYASLSSGDIPVFECGDSSAFIIMKTKSDNPNAVWFQGSIKVEESFERFIYNLYHDSPDYYSRDW